MTAETTYTLEALEEFYRAAAHRMGSGRYLALRVGYLLGGAALIAAGVYYMGQVFLAGDWDIVTVALTLLCLVLGVQVFWMGVSFYHFYARRAMKSLPENARRNYYRFEDNQIVISNRGKSTSFPYEQFGVIYETEKRFLLYINAYNGYILEKSGLKDTTPEALRNFLNAKREDPVEPLA